MNFLAGVLLTWLPAEADAFAALSLLMRQRGLREMYLPDMSLLQVGGACGATMYGAETVAVYDAWEGRVVGCICSCRPGALCIWPPQDSLRCSPPPYCLQVRLWQLSKLLPPRLAAHLEAHTVLPVLYASSWLLTAFAAGGRHSEGLAPLQGTEGRAWQAGRAGVWRFTAPRRCPEARGPRARHPPPLDAHPCRLPPALCWAAGGCAADGAPGGVPSAQGACREAGGRRQDGCRVGSSRASHQPASPGATVCLLACWMPARPSRQRRPSGLPSPPCARWPWPSCSAASATCFA